MSANSTTRAGEQSQAIRVNDPPIIFATSIWIDLGATRVSTAAAMNEAGAQIM